MTFELKPFDQLAKEKNVEKIESTQRLDVIVPELKKNFLKHFRENGLIKTAAELIGVDQPKIYEWMGEDEDFKEQVNIAREQMLPMLEEAMFARALSGKSDLMLIFLAKSLKPEKYDEKAREPPKQDGITLNIIDVGGKNLTSGEKVINPPDVVVVPTNTSGAK
jgi:hypothetical protein